MYTKLVKHPKEVRKYFREKSAKYRAQLKEKQKASVTADQATTLADKPPNKPILSLEEGPINRG